MNSKSIDLRAKKSLGQNFLVNDKIIYQIINKVVEVSQGDVLNVTVLEIGPGTGALTKELLKAGFQVHAVEKDERAFSHLKNELLPNYANKLNLIEGDILKFDPNQISVKGKLICVGNIPYYITSDILMWMCQYRNLFSNAVFMVQNEVALRITAKTSTKNYSRLSVKLQLLYEIENFLFVPASSFVPKPKVDSAVVCFTPAQQSRFQTLEEEKKFENFCARLFSGRRKMIRKILEIELQRMNKEKFFSELRKLGIDETFRPDAISPQNTLSLFRFVYDQKFYSE